MQPAPERNPATDAVQMIEPRRCLVIVSAATAAAIAPATCSSTEESLTSAIARPPAARIALTGASTRSEEHTSELQSQSNLVCRLLLETKKSPTLPQSRRYISTSSTHLFQT